MTIIAGNVATRHRRRHAERRSTLASALYLEKPEDRDSYERVFDQLGEVAESPDCSAESLTKLLYEIDSR
ncbi:hypothetical protein GCM10009558_001450 [Virgisporangium aurantiacum]